MCAESESAFRGWAHYLSPWEPRRGPRSLAVSSLAQAQRRTRRKRREGKRMEGKGKQRLCRGEETRGKERRGEVHLRKDVRTEHEQTGEK